MWMNRWLMTLDAGAGNNLWVFLSLLKISHLVTDSQAGCGALSLNLPSANLPRNLVADAHKPEYLTHL